MTSIEPYYALATGLLLVSAAHALRLGVMPEDPKARKAIALAGTAVYGLGSWAGLCKSPWAAYIAIVFPVIGILAVLVTKNRPDAWQLGVGVLQVVLMSLASWLILGGM